jgi:hypothetical protein
MRAAEEHKPKSIILGGGVFVGNTFVDFKSLIYSPWGYGMMIAQEGGMSFQVGLTQWLVIALSLILFIYLLFRKKIDLQSRNSLFYFFAFLISIVMMLPVSLGFWKLLSTVIVIDFTWRVLAVCVFASAVLAGFITSKYKYSFLLGASLIILAIFFNRNHLRINKIQDWDLPFYLKLERTTNQYDEYTPKWVDSGLVREKAKDKILFSQSDSPVIPNVNKSNQLDFFINATESGIVRINTVYYPGWKGYVNDKEIPLSPNRDLGGIMTLPISEGSNHIKLIFKETPLRTISDGISILSGIIMLSGIVISKKKDKNRK